MVLRVLTTFRRLRILTGEVERSEEGGQEHGPSPDLLL